MQKRKVIVAITGASGSIYGKQILEKLQIFSSEIEEVGVIFSSQGTEVWKLEVGKQFEEINPFRLYKHDDFYAPFASGSAGFETMIICPCSMGTVGRIANGFSDDLITRAADVMLKERKKLIIVPREAPYNIIHLKNMLALTEAGAIIFPASPSYYSKPVDIEELASTVSNRILALAGFDINLYRWGDV
jgi:4-hydroxy-3-polyprenylbenzoate decarboxylase